jgi:hypothetical protein
MTVIAQVKGKFEVPLRGRLITKVAKTETSLSANFPKLSGDFEECWGQAWLEIMCYWQKVVCCLNNNTFWMSFLP